MLLYIVAPVISLFVSWYGAHHYVLMLFFLSAVVQIYSVSQYNLSSRFLLV